MPVMRSARWATPEKKPRRPPKNVSSRGGRGFPAGGSRRERLQRISLTTLAEAPQGPVTQLADTLPRHAEHVADLLESVLPLAFKSEVQAKHAGVTRLESVQAAPTVSVKSRLSTSCSGSAASSVMNRSTS